MTHEDMVTKIWDDCTEDDGLAKRGFARHQVQNVPEMVGFLQAVEATIGDKRDVALEVGLYYGGTHLVWRRFGFKTVVSIECEQEKILQFQRWQKNPDGSRFVLGDSKSKDTLARVKIEICSKPVDMLFIDGAHDYATVNADYGNYAPLVRDGGIIGFHDSHIACFDIGRFLSDLEQGRTTHPVPKPITRIHLSEMGIAWHVK